MTTLEALQKAAIIEIEAAQDSKQIEQLKVKYLGKKGPVADLMKSLKECTPEERPQKGAQINRLKQTLHDRIEQKLVSLGNAELNTRLEQEWIDISLPGKQGRQAKEHIISQVIDEAIGYLKEMGFSVQYGPDVESDYYNFEALNFSEDHPARAMHDTFYIAHNMLLRTHTSNTQVRIMETSKPPIRIMAPGKCFRNENISARSHVLFHQLEGVYIDKEVTFADLFATLEEFFSKLFAQSVRMRYRPSYFPFVEPGVEVDVECLNCHGKGCHLCKKTGWLEVAGAGLIHPEVLKNGGIDPEEYSGFAWGMGFERLALLRYGIDDIRLFMENRMSFLQQF